MQISQIPSIGKDTTEKLASLSIRDTKDLKFISPEDLVRVLGIGVKKIINIYAVAGIPLDSNKISELNRMTENKKIEGKQFSKGRISIKAPTPIVVGLSDYSDKHLALAQFLELDEEDEDELNEIEESSYEESLFKRGDEEYLVLTDDEADKKTKERISNLIDDMPEFFIDRAIMFNAIDENWFEEDERESSESYANDIKDVSSTDEDLYVNRLHQEMVEENILEELELPEEPNEKLYGDDGETLDENGNNYDESYDNWVADCGEIKSDMETEVENSIDEFVNERQSGDSIEHYKLNFGDKDLAYVIKKYNLIDEDKLVQAIFDDYIDRGNEISTYDSIENEQGEYYIYRIN